MYHHHRKGGHCRHTEICRPEGDTNLFLLEGSGPSVAVAARL
jgi:hypothetical protein